MFNLNVNPPAGPTPEATGHSPEPWTLGYDPQGTGDYWLYDRNGNAIGEVAFISDTPADAARSEANARLLKTAPGLVKFARSARNSFAERLSCLRSERIDSVFDDGDDQCPDIDDQIGNYEHLLEQADAVITEAEGR